MPTVSSSREGRSGRGRRAPNWVSWLVLVIGLALTLGLHGFSQRWIRSAGEARFLLRSSEFKTALHTHLAAWPRDALMVASAANPNGLIGGSGRIERRPVIVCADDFTSRGGHADGAIGALDWTPAERRKLARESSKFRCPACCRAFWRLPEG